jgi:hypothetical protein
MEREREPRRRGDRVALPLGPPEPVHPLLALQRAAGNRAVAQALMRHKRTLDEAPPEWAYAFAAAVKPGTGPGASWSLERPTRVSGEIHSTQVPARDATATPQAYHQTDQLGVITTNRLPGYDGGHLIGLHLGGENQSVNVVPMFPGFNRGVWKNMEDATKRHMDTTPGTYRMTVELDYTAATLPEVPTTLRVTREVESMDGTWVQALPAVTLSQPADILVTARLSATDEATVNPPANTPLAAMAPGLQPDLFATGDLTLDQYVNHHGHLPQALRTLYPDAPANRPYERLDLLTLNGTIPAHTSMQAFAEYSAAQRALILQTNMARNGGRLRSDDPADPHQWLDERGTADAPEIDHIVPKSHGGSNFYSNARVISWQLNNREARVKPLRGLIDTSRLALPTLPRLIPRIAETLIEQVIIRSALPSITPAAIVDWALANRYNVSATPRMLDTLERQLAALVDEGRLTRSGAGYVIV